MKRHNRYFEIYISRCIEQICCKKSITADAKQQLSELLYHLASIIGDTVEHILVGMSRRTCSEEYLLDSCEFVLGSELWELVQPSSDSLIRDSLLTHFLKNFTYRNIHVSHNVPEQFARVMSNLLIYIVSQACEISTKVRLTTDILQQVVHDNPLLYNLFQRNRMYFNANLYVTTHAPDTFYVSTQSQPITYTMIAKFPFQRMVRESVKNSSLKVSSEVFDVLQYYIESYMTEFLIKTKKLVDHCSRSILSLEDVKFVNGI